MNACVWMRNLFLRNQSRIQELQWRNCNKSINFLLFIQEISPKPQSQKKNEADISSSANIQKSALLSSTLSSGKARSKKCKQESGDSAGCIKPPKPPMSPELIQVEDLTLVSQLPSSVINKTSEHRHFKTYHNYLLQSYWEIIIIWGFFLICFILNVACWYLVGLEEHNLKCK